ncbi:MAG: mandelate racemase/muconate lactonizing enzyme family protein [Pontibacterium sp.]
MRITRVTCHKIGQPLSPGFESATMQFHQRQHLLVEIECDNGTIGWGECLGVADANRTYVNAMANLLIGKNPLDIEPLWLNLYNTFRDQGQRGAVINAISGIDVALWDIKGKVLDMPVYQLMGGAFRTEIPLYATGGFRPMGQPRLEALKAEVSQMVENGFSAVKIKIGFGIDADLEAIALTRELIGPDRGLMIDANHGYDAVAAIRLGNAAAAFNIDWFEEPVVPEVLSQYQDVRAKQPIPVAAGETWHTKWGIQAALTAQAVDILQPDVCGIGGLSEAKKVLTLCEANATRVVPHVWGTGIAIAAGLHFHAIIPPNPAALEPLNVPFEYDQTENLFQTQLLSEPLRQHNGLLSVPQQPGLGVDVNRDVLAKFTVA